MANRWGNDGNSEKLYWLQIWLQNHCRRWLQPWNYNMLAPWKKSVTDLHSILQRTEILPCQQSPSIQSYGFSSSHAWMWELDHKEIWELKKWCFWTVVLEKTLECPLDWKEVQPVHPEGDQSWVFIGRTDAEAEASIPWPPDAKNWLLSKDPDAGKD